MFLFTILLCLTSSVFAQSYTGREILSRRPAAVADDGSLIPVETLCLRANQPESNTAYCPPAEHMVYNDTSLIWSAPPNWKSATQSFARSNLSFIGVKWQGTAMGSMVCQYQAPDRGEFSVQLSSPRIFYRPDTIVDQVIISSTYRQPLWRKENAQGTSYNCFSNDVCGCPILEYLGDTRSLEEIVNSIEKTPDDLSWMNVL